VQANPSLEGRLAGEDWAQHQAALLAQGYTVTDPLLTGAECDALSGGFGAETGYRKHVVGYRKHVVMARHNYGRGDYKYYAYPLPEVVATLRRTVYPHLVPAANEWAARLRRDIRFPAAHADYIRQCHQAGQERPTPLVLRYGAGDFNCLHQDLYGDLHFPYQMALLLSDPVRDFSGGEFLLVENRPRAQSVGTVVPLRKGQSVIFAVNVRPRKGARGYHRATMRHGVSEVRTGSRFTLGIIFHDAR
jgi:hypothetical protein